MGGQRETFMGLSGLGDLVLTCSDDQSRNRRFGLALGKGMDVDTARKTVNQVVEDKSKAYIQCPDPYQCTNGGTVIFEISKRP